MFFVFFFSVLLFSSIGFANDGPGPAEFALLRYDTDGQLLETRTGFDESYELHEWAMATNGDVYFIAGDILVGRAYQLVHDEDDPILFEKEKHFWPNYVETDPDGNVFLGGYRDTDGTTWLKKYSRSGEKLWSVPAPGWEDSSLIYGLYADSLGNVYLSGDLDGSLFAFYQFDGDGQYNFLDDYPITDGDRSWPNAAIDENGNLYAASTIQSDKSDSTRLIVASYDTEGELVWDAMLLFSLDKDCELYVSDIIVDSTGRTAVAAINSCDDYKRSFSVMMFDDEGELLWKEDSEDKVEPGQTIAAMAFVGDEKLAAAGITYNEDYKGLFQTILYDENGNRLWTQGFAQNPWESSVDVNAMVADSQKNIYVLGMEKHEEWEYLLLKYNEAGQQQWQATYHHELSTSNDEGRFMKFGEDGFLYVAGSALVTIDDDFLDDDNDDDTFSNDDDSFVDDDQVDDDSGNNETDDDNSSAGAEQDDDDDDGCGC